MSLKNYPTPHCHQHSLDTGSLPQAFADVEKKLGTGCLVTTDHGTVSGCYETYKLARKSGLVPVIGIEGYYRSDDCKILESSGLSKDDKGTYKPYWSYGHLTIHSLDQEAYETIGKRLSEADALRGEQHGSERKPIFNLPDIEEICSKNVTMGSGCLIGVVARHLMLGRPDIAEKYYCMFRELVKPQNWYVEVMPHRCTHNWVSGIFIKREGAEKDLKCWAGKKFRISDPVCNEREISAKDLAELWAKEISKDPHWPAILMAQKDYNSWTELNPAAILDVRHIEDFVQNECTPDLPDGDIQIRANRFMLDLAKKYGDKIIVSDDSHLATPDDKAVQDIRLLASAGGNWRFHEIYSRKSSDESFAYFRDHMGISEAEFSGWVDNGYEWLSRFGKGWEWKSRRQLPSHFYPEDTVGYTMKLIKEVGRMKWHNKEWTDRLKSEFQLLHDNGEIDLLPYFFVISDVSKFLEGNGVLTGAGRGSAAGLLLAYLLGVTHVNPLKYGLSKERFLTETRVKSGKLPDVDYDSGDRTYLFGGDVPQLKVSLEDGSEKICLPSQKVKTDRGEMTLQQAHDTQADILGWV